MKQGKYWGVQSTIERERRRREARKLKFTEYTETAKRDSLYPESRVTLGIFRNIFYSYENYQSPKHFFKANWSRNCRLNMVGDFRKGRIGKKYTKKLTQVRGIAPMRR